MTEQKQQELSRQKAIGQFFTPRIVVEFIYDMLKVHLDKGDKWKKGKIPSIIDPACGEGVFLKVALDKDMTKPIYVFGVDLDEKVKEKWIEINLLKSFGSRAELDIHFYHQNGLLPLPEKVLRYKRGGLNQYDLVVGNPPYGGVGIQEITPQLHDALLKYEIWRRSLKQNGNKQNGKVFLFDEMPENLTRNQGERLKKFPIEILFMERFIQLCKPEGHIAIIIPDGILSNSNLHYVREFIAQKVIVNAIVSLPRETFKDAGTSAKTSILFMTKPKEDKRISKDYKIFLSVVNKLESLPNVSDYYKEVNKMNSAKNNLVKVVNDSQGNEIAMVRIDKTLKDLSEERPHSRWDPYYWHPRGENIFEGIVIEIKPLSDFLPRKSLVFPDHVRQSLGEKVEKNQAIAYFRVTEFLDTGYNYAEQYYCSKNAYERLKHTQLQDGDVIIAYSGATLGSTLIIENAPKTSCTGDLYVAR